MKKTNEEKRRSAAKHKTQKRTRRIAAGFFVILCVCLTFSTFFVYAHENRAETAYTYYKSVEIQPATGFLNVSRN